MTVVERNDVALTTPEETAYAYDLQGNLDLQVNPNGVISDYDYDILNRLTDLVHYLPDETPETLADNDKLAQFEYTVRDDGRRTSATEKFWFDSAAHVNNITWTYDDAGRLIDEVFDHYDDQHDQTQHFTYDLVGNRLTRTVDIGNDASIDQVFASLYDANDRLLTEEADTDGTAGVDQTTTYGYTGTQQTGKTVVEGSTMTSETTFEYNLRGQLQQVTTTANGSTTVSEYEYDHNGVRVKQTVTINAGTPVVTTYLIDAQNFTGYAKPIAEFVDGVQSRIYTFGHQIISQADSSGNVQHFVLDGSGSTRLLVNAALSILETYHFDAWGEALGFDPAQALTTWLRSQDSQHDQSTGLEYHLARWRDGHRFLTLDPFFGNLNDPQSLHKYLYANADSINAIDPTGLTSLISGLGAISIIGVLNVLIAPKYANAPGRSGEIYRDNGDPLVEVLIYELAFVPIGAGLSFLAAPAASWIYRTALRRSVTMGSDVVLGMAGKVVRVSGAKVLSKGPLAVRARELLKKAAEIAGRNIDELADVIGATSRESGTKIPFVGMSDETGELVVSITEDILDDIAETQLLKALHELNHLIDIKDAGWGAVRSMYTQNAAAVERDVEMRAWNMLVNELGEGAIPAATERAHREFLDNLARGN